MSFAHLHLHTHSSLLDGMIREDKLVEEVKRLGQDSVAVTDHGWIAGAVKLVQACKEHDIKPIIGSELYMTAAGSMQEKAQHGGDQYHLTVLVQNRVGYRNLMMLTTKAHLRGFSYRPRVDRVSLEEHSEGLIVMSGCWGAEIPSNIQQDIHERGEVMPGTLDIIEWYQKTFGDRFFFEIMSHGSTEGLDHVREVDEETGEIILEEHELNDVLRSLSQEMGIPLVATNDAHYLREDDGHAHDALLCLGMGGNKTNPKRMRFAGADAERWEFYVKDEENMHEAGGGVDWWVDACDRTQEIADSIDSDIIQLKQQVMPVFDIPEAERLALKVWQEQRVLI